MINPLNISCDIVNLILLYMILSILFLKNFFVHKQKKQVLLVKFYKPYMHLK